MRPDARWTRLTALLLVLALCMAWVPAQAAGKKLTISADWRETTTGARGGLNNTGSADNSTDRRLEITITAEGADRIDVRYYNTKGKAEGPLHSLIPDSRGRVSYNLNIRKSSPTGTYKVRIDARRGKNVTTKYVKFKLTKYVYRAVPDAALQAKLDYLQRVMPTGKYWNHGRKGQTTVRLGGKLNITTTICSQGCPAKYQRGEHFRDSDATCNYAYHGYQCHGWAMMLAAYCWDADPGNFRRETDSYIVDNLRPGDVVRYLNDQHTIFVLKVEKDTVYFTDCNYGLTCRIRWNGRISTKQLRKTFSYAILHP